MLPALLAAPAGPLRCTQNQTLGVGGMEPLFDCVTELWYSERTAPKSFSKLAPDSSRWLALTVLECETAFSH